MANIIIMSPSKEMVLEPGTQALIDHFSLSQEIIQEIQTWPQATIAKKMSVNDSIAHQVFHFYQDINKKTAKPAYLTYSGLAFRQIAWSDLDLDYAKEHLNILSALYGPLSPLDPINPYRLDFSMGVKIGKTSIKTLWKDRFKDYFKDQTIYNLASKEFSDLLDPNSCLLISIEFLKANGKPHPSATAKKLRGQVANQLLKAQSFEAEVFKGFLTDDFNCHYDLENQKITYQNK